MSDHPFRRIFSPVMLALMLPAGAALADTPEVSLSGEGQVRYMPDSARLYLFRGAALEKDLRFDEAVMVYERGLERLPGEVRLYQYLGSGYEQQARWDEAVAVYRRGLVNVKEQAPLYVSWGFALSRQQQWQEAIALLHRVQSQRMDPNVITFSATIQVGEKGQQWHAALALVHRT